MSRIKRFMVDVFSPRAYARNHQESAPHRRIIGCYGVATLGVLFFLFFPFRYVGTMVLLGFLFPIFFDVVQSANRTRWFAVVNMLLGVLGVCLHWPLGLTLFGFHFEWLVFWALGVTGALALLRRLWNAFIWTLLDTSGGKPPLK